jgi:hypothetical protein
LIVEVRGCEHARGECAARGPFDLTVRVKQLVNLSMRWLTLDIEGKVQKVDGVHHIALQRRSGDSSLTPVTLMSKHLSACIKRQRQLLTRFRHLSPNILYCIDCGSAQDMLHEGKETD